LASAAADPLDDGSYSGPLTIHTPKFGHVEGDPAPTQPSFVDIGKVVDKFKGKRPPFKAHTMLNGNVPELNANVGFLDINKVVAGFKSQAYVESGPSTCL